MISSIVLLLPLLTAQVPAHDSRNTEIPNTDTHFAMPAWKDRAAWEKRKVQLRRQILFASGLDPMPEKTPLHAQIFGKITTNDCTIEKVLIEAMPGYWLGGNLYRPLNDFGKHPAVLNPHGHWAYGRLENQPLYSGPQLGANFARQGYVVFAWDMVGYNDTIQTPHAFGSPTEQLWGFGPFGLQIWNAIRAVDFISSLDDVDSNRIAMTGASGGGTQTYSLAAVDDRVQFYAPINMISGIMQGGDFCENAPGLRLGTNNVEIAAMIAPKPMIMVSATGDWTKNNPTEEFPALKRIYELYDKAANVENVHLDAPHNYKKENREAVYRFFAKHILNSPDAAKIVEKNAEVPKLQDMLALSGRPQPAGSLNYSQIFEQWKRRPAGDPKALMTEALAVEWPDEVINDSAALSRPAVGDRIPYRFTEGQGAPILLLDGSAPTGRPSLKIEPFQTGSAVAPRDREAKHFEAFNRTDDQCRVQDILTALAWLHKKYPGAPIEIQATQMAPSIWAEFAAAVSPIPLRLHINTAGFHGTDDDFLKHLNVPGIQLAGGFAAAEKLTAALH